MNHLLLITLLFSLAYVLLAYCWPYIVLILALLSFPLRDYANPLPSRELHLYPLHPAFFAALQQVESSNRTGRIVGDGGYAIGPFQIHYAYWRDAKAYDCTLTGIYSNCYDEGYSRRVVTAYLNRYAPQAVRDNDFEVLARLHHCGPHHPISESFLRYWSHFERALYHIGAENAAHEPIFPQYQPLVLNREEFLKP